MKPNLVTFTHKGWFGICPVYLSGVDTDSPYISPRFKYTSWLIDVSTVVYDALFYLRTSVDPFYEPLWPMHITGELTPPLVKDVSND